MPNCAVNSYSDLTDGLSALPTWWKWTIPWFGSSYVDSPVVHEYLYVCAMHADIHISYIPMMMTSPPPISHQPSPMSHHITNKDAMIREEPSCSMQCEGSVNISSEYQDTHANRRAQRQREREGERERGREIQREKEKRVRERNAQ